MPSVSNIIWNLTVRLLLVIVAAVLLIPLMLLLLIPKKWRFGWPLYVFMHCMYWIILKVTFLPITYIDAKNIPANPAIIVANHQSSLDIPLVGNLVDGFPHVWTAKSDIQQESKVLGFIVPRVAVMVDMSSPQRALRVLLSLIAQSQRKKQHIIIFPEGGRYVDGEIHDFFSGFAILAKRTGMPVVPVHIFNADKAYPPGTFWASYVPITVRVGEPMVIKNEETEEDFKNRVRSWFVKEHSSAE